MTRVKLSPLQAKMVEIDQHRLDELGAKYIREGCAIRQCIWDTVRIGHPEINTETEVWHITSDCTEVFCYADIAPTELAKSEADNAST